MVGVLADFDEGSFHETIGLMAFALTQKCGLRQVSGPLKIN